MCETGQFATLWKKLAERLGLVVEFVPGDWRRGADPAAIEERLVADREHRIKAVCVVHNETSTGVTSRIPEVRRAIDRSRSPRPAAGRHDLVARLGRLPARRMGRRRHRRRFAEGPDAAARTVVQRDQREGARRIESREDAALLLGLERDARAERQRLLPVHAGDQPALRPARGDRDAARRGAAERLRAPRTPRAGDPRRGARLGPRSPVRQSRGIQSGADRDPHARRATAPTPCARSR